jgi:hypothetical protein
MSVPEWIKKNPAAAAAAAAGIYGVLNKDSGIGKFLTGGSQRPVGYMGGIPEYTIAQELAPNAFATTTPTGEPRRPGSGGRRYFTDTVYTPTGKTMGPKPSGAAPAAGLFDSLTAEQAQEMINGMFGTGGVSRPSTPVPMPKPAPQTKYTDAQVKGTLDTLIAQNPNRGEGLYRAIGEQIKSSGVSIEAAAKQLASLMPEFSEQEIIAKYKQMGFAQGGLASLPQSQGYYLGGATDGMADQIPANINGQQEAALSDGEFVMPADVVSHLGNGNSDAGAKVLYSMMDRVRQARTGTKEQGRKITPNKFTPA